MPVVALDSATIIGEVRDVMFDPRQVAFVGFTLRGRGFLSAPFSGYLPADAVRAVGHDAVMIEGEQRLLRDPAQIAENVGEKRDALGTQVVADTGETLGEVSDLVLEVGDGVPAVVGYCVEREDGVELIVPAPEGPRDWDDIVVVPTSAIEHSSEGLKSFRDVLEQMRTSRSGVGL